MTYYPSVKEAIAPTYPRLSRPDLTPNKQPFVAQEDSKSLLEDLAGHILRLENPDQVAAYLDSRFGKMAISQFEPEQGFSSAQQQFSLLGLNILYENNRPRVLIFKKLLSFKKLFFRPSEHGCNTKTGLLAHLRQQEIGFVNLGSVVITTTHHASNAGAIMCSYFFRPAAQEMMIEEITYHYLLSR
ncbi:hypothetical protein [Alkanindiges illinoisensis]|uniref:hypothetical protein n=1 Tax=Alkanindiges illinoisensis TaxID=197183 RepID=UPI00047AE891|nr:hypothetical protein [Alkanindiges illinoisensis]